MCTHVQVCNLASSLSPEIKVQIPEIPKGDPHLYSPGPDSIKKYIESELLLVAPLELNPWAQKIVFIRKKQNRPTLVLKIEKTSPKIGSEAQAHFWLNPKNLCETRSQIAQFLKIENTICLYTEKFKSNIEKLEKMSDQTFVIAHDALSVLFSMHNIPFLALQGGGHDHEIGPKTLKALYQTLKSKNSVIWIEEPPIVFPPKIKSLVRNSDVVLKINVDGILGDAPDKILSNFFEQLEEIRK
ncbi:MAG: hypothetical protein Fur0010_25480 [Bdellovibrio sp.]